MPGSMLRHPFHALCIIRLLEFYTLFSINDVAKVVKLRLIMLTSGDYAFQKLNNQALLHWTLVGVVYKF